MVIVCFVSCRGCRCGLTDGMHLPMFSRRRLILRVVLLLLAGISTLCVGVRGPSGVVTTGSLFIRSGHGRSCWAGPTIVRVVDVTLRLGAPVRFEQGI